MATLQQISKGLTEFVFGASPSPEAYIRVYACGNRIEVYGMSATDCWLIAEFSGHWHACRVIDFEIEWGDQTNDPYGGYDGRFYPWTLERELDLKNLATLSPPG